jgi:alkanesulfonate monooxygenase SsuD/methylene tetrahydromethanopterin reductase-like flavin-dependent oxidoreductase (luciferase family)
MKLGIGITTFPWPAEEIGPVVTRIAESADQAGVDSLWVMDHFFQIRLSGLPPESPMPEAYATLAFLGGLTRRIRLGTLVTSVAYRHPGVLVKAVTSLDVLTGGRVIFGVGAGAPWNVAPAGPGTVFEAEGLGIPFPSLAERF